MDKLLEALLAAKNTLAEKGQRLNATDVKVLLLGLMDPVERYLSNEQESTKRLECELAQAQSRISILEEAQGYINDTFNTSLKQSKLDLARERYNASSVDLDRANIQHRMALAISQGDPVAALGLDRDAVRKLIFWIQSGRLPEEAKK